MRAAAGLLAIVFIGSVSAIYDCRRDPAALCQNGGTCDANGDCTGCGSGFEGYDCSVVTADKADAACTTNPCNNGGTCHKAAADATATCLCAADFTGATCDDKRYDLTCDTVGNTMTMIIRPFGDITGGTISVEGQTAAACVFAGDPLTITALDNTGASPCGETTDTTVGADTISERYVIVRFIADQLSTRDERVTFTCGTGTTVSKSSAAIAVTAVDAGLHPEGESNVPVDADVSFAVTSGGAAITAPLNLGTEVKVEIDLTPVGLERYAGVRFKQCSAGSHVDDTDAAFTSKLFVDSFCVHDDLKTLMMTGMARTGTVVSYTFELFKFDVTDNLVVTCIVEVCTNAGDCDPEACNGEAAGSETGFGRRKRQAGTTEKILQRSISITDPLQAAANTLQEFKETKACYQSWEMTATVVALSVALLLVLLLCIILIIKAILNRRGRTTYREDASDTTSTSHFPHLPTIVSNKA